MMTPLHIHSSLPEVEVGYCPQSAVFFVLLTLLLTLPLTMTLMLPLVTPLMSSLGSVLVALRVWSTLHHPCLLNFLTESCFPCSLLMRRQGQVEQSYQVLHWAGTSVSVLR